MSLYHCKRIKNKQNNIKILKKKKLLYNDIIRGKKGFQEMIIHDIVRMKGSKNY